MTVADVASICGGEFLGNDVEAQSQVDGVAAIHTTGPSKVSWLTDKRHAASLADCPAAAVVGSRADVGDFPRAIVCDDPEMAMVKLLGAFHCAVERPEPGVHPTAVVDSTVDLGAEVAVGPHCVVKAGAKVGARTVLHAGCVVGAEVEIGEDCVLYEQVILYDRTLLRNRVIIHSHTTVGADGFGYVFRDNCHHRYPHIGSVLIEDDVEIGANCCIDRGKVGPTKIGAGCKIDNLVQVGHNVEIGPLSILVGQSGVGGSTKLGPGVMLGGMAGIIDGRIIGDGTMIAAGSCVYNHSDPRDKLMGIPAIDSMRFKRESVHSKKLDQLYKRVSELEKQLAEVRGALAESNSSS